MNITPSTRRRVAAGLAAFGIAAASVGLSVGGGLSSLASSSTPEPQRITFASGTEFGTVSGAIEANTPVSYVLSAGDSRTMVIALASTSGHVSMTVTDPSGSAMHTDGATAFSATLESGMGDYTIELSASASDNYGMTVYIPAPTGGGGGGNSGGGNNSGGGSAQAGAPSFTSFTASSPVKCESGNATVTMAYETMNVVSIAIKIGNGNFASTAGYGPNETSVVASIPCNGAGSSTIQLKGCTENNTCAESDIAKIEITS